MTATTPSRSLLARAIDKGTTGAAISAAVMAVNWALNVQSVPGADLPCLLALSLGGSVSAALGVDFGARLPREALKSTTLWAVIALPISTMLAFSSAVTGQALVTTGGSVMFLAGAWAWSRQREA